MNPTIVDLSHNNADIQFHDLRGAGILAVFLKASQGTGMRDETFVDRVQRARDCGLRVGAYHFLDGQNAQIEMANFKAAISGQGPLVLALDFESNPAGASATAPICSEAMTLLAHETGRHPVIYGSNFLSLLYPDPSTIAECPLWEARYSTHLPVPPAPWAEWTIWQYSESGPIAGRDDIDCSVYNFNFFDSDAEFLTWWDGREVTL